MKVIKCDRCGEICSIGRGVTFTHNNGSTADFCPDCYENFKKWLKREEQEKKTAEQEKPRMTCREWLVKHFPKRVSRKYGGDYQFDLPGGCAGCPKDHTELGGIEHLCERDNLLFGSAELCEKCWSQPVPEGVE